MLQRRELWETMTLLILSSLKADFAFPLIKTKLVVVLQETDSDQMADILFRNSQSWDLPGGQKINSSILVGSLGYE